MTDKVNRFTPRQVARGLEDVDSASLRELKTKLKGSPRQEFLKNLQADLREQGTPASRVTLAQLRSVVADELLAVQRAVQGPRRGRARTIDLADVKSNFGSFAAKLLKSIDSQRATRRAKPRGPTPKQKIMAAAARREALGTFRDYFPEAGRLPAFPPDVDTISTFTERQARWVHRMYWSAGPNVGLPELAEMATRAKEFKGRDKEFRDYHFARLFAAMPESFPWTKWRERRIHCASYHLVEKSLQSPAGTTVKQMFDQLEEKYPGFPYYKIAKNWPETVWTETREDGSYILPFVDLLERDESGGFVLEGKAPTDPFQRDGKGRLLLTEELARAVAEMGVSDDVLYGWSLPNFITYVADRVPGKFTKNSYESLLKKYPLLLPSWTKLKRKAMVRLGAKIKELHEQRNIDSSGEIIDILHDDLGYKKFKRTDIDYIRDTVAKDGVEVPFFHAAKSRNREKEARALLDEVTRGGGTWAEAGARIGIHDEERIKYLANIARTTWPREFKKSSSSRTRYTERDLALLEKLTLAAPIGSRSRDIYRELEKNHPRFTERHPLTEPRTIGGQIRDRLQIESWSDFQHTRLAQLLAEVAADCAPGTGLDAQIETARQRHDIAYSDVRIRDLIAEWRKNPDDVAVEGLVDATGMLPWDRVADNQYEAATRRWAAWYPASQFKKNTRWVPAGKTVQSFDDKQVKAIYDAYWSAPPQTETEDLAAQLASKPAFSGREVLTGQLNGLFNRMRAYFPWGMRFRSFALRSFVLLEELEKAPSSQSTRALLEVVEKNHDGFSAQAFSKAAGTTWTSDADRFPFVAEKLEKKDGAFIIRGLAAPTSRFRRGSRTILSQELADEVSRLSRNPRIRYDWSSEDVREFFSRELGFEFTSANHIGLRRKFDMPDYTEIRRVARENFCRLYRELATGDPPIRTAERMIRVLQAEHGYPEYEANRFASLRAEFGPAAVPLLRPASAEKTYEEAMKLLEEIEANPKKGYYQIGLEHGWDMRATDHRLLLIRRYRPGRLKHQNVGKPYTRADRAKLREALEDAPVGCSVRDVLDILRAEHPDFFGPHPISSPAALGQALKTQLGLGSWHEYHHERLQRLVAEVAGRSRAGISQVELYRVLRDEYDLRYSYPSFARQMRAWNKSPAKYPILAKPLLDSNGKFPWNLRTVPATVELAARIGQAMGDNPELEPGEIVALLRRDTAFTRRYPNFDERAILSCRAKFPNQVPRLRLLRKDPKAKARRAALEKLAGRIAALGAGHEQPGLLSSSWLARELGAEERDVHLAMQKFATEIPWRVGSAGNVDLTLAAKVGDALYRAPLGKSLEQIQDELMSDPQFQENYPSFNYSTFGKLQDAFPDIVPSWPFRQLVLESRLLTDAVITAERGASFESILDELRGQYPGAFAASEPQRYVELWKANPKQFPFADALEKRGKYVFSGQGGQIPPRSEDDLALASRLALEIQQIPEKFPITHAVTEGISPTHMANCEVLYVQHYLGQQIPFLDECARVGVKPEQTTIIGIPYSTNDTVVAVLRDKGWDARVPPLDIPAWTEMIREAMYERLDAAIAQGRRVVVVDDGGIVSKLIETDPYLQDHRDLFSVVEQTTRGVTVRDEYDTSTPLMNVAQSIAKALEGYMLNHPVHGRLVKRLERLGVDSVKDKQIGVIGLGPTGLPSALKLAEEGAMVTIRDLDESAIEEALATAKKLGLSDRFRVAASDEEFFGEQDIIIGATGMNSMGPDELALVRDGTVLGSISSKVVEIDLQALALEAKKKGGKIEVVDERSSPPTVRYTLPDGRSFDVLASGFPLNFDGDVNCIDPQQIQLTCALLLLGMVDAADAGVAGVQRLDVEKQLELVRKFKELDVVKADPVLYAETEKAEAELEEAMDSPRANYRRPVAKSPT